MNMRLTLLVALVLMGRVVYGGAEEGDAIVGQWLTSEKDARIEIFRTDGKYDGKIVWLKDPTYPKEDLEAGKPVHDRKNPDITKRDQPILGSTLLSNFEYVGDNHWKNGTIYNAENGKTYKAHLSLAKDGSLKVRGYWGISLLGETTIWTRFDDPAKAQDKKQDAPSAQGGVKRAKGD